MSKKFLYILTYAGLSVLFFTSNGECTVPAKGKNDQRECKKIYGDCYEWFHSTMPTLRDTDIRVKAHDYTRDKFCETFGGIGGVDGECKRLWKDPNLHWGQVCTEIETFMHSIKTCSGPR